MKIKLRKADTKFTQLVREIYGYRCQRCGRAYMIDGVKVGNLGSLGVSHYYGRKRESTRFDLDNVTLLCNFPCHEKWEKVERGEYEKYMIKRLGQEGFDLLTWRSHLYAKRDDVLNIFWIEQELKELGESSIRRE